MDTVTTAVPGAPDTPAAAHRSWLDRLCARLGGWCDLLRGAHDARVPF